MQEDTQDTIIADLVARISRLEQRFSAFEERDRIFEKAFRVIGLHTNYAEFGAYKGHSLVSAYYSARKICDEFLGGNWNHAFANPDETASVVINHWNNMRFFAFDSFQGLPATRGPDKEMEIFKEGTYCCGSDEFMATLRKYAVPQDKVVAVPGFFNESCTAENVAPLQFGNIGIVHIDCDLYESAKTVLDFITPYLCGNAIIIFDEWYQFFGNPNYGEQRAFAEWRAANPQWVVTEFQREGAFRMSFILTKR